MMLHQRGRPYQPGRVAYLVKLKPSCAYIRAAKAGAERVSEDAKP
jgi:hypothetical protein